MHRILHNMLGHCVPRMSMSVQAQARALRSSMYGAASSAFSSAFVGGSQQRMWALDMYTRVIVAERYEQMHRKPAPWYLLSIDRDLHRWPVSTDWFLCDQMELWGQRDEVWADDTVLMMSFDVDSSAVEERMAFLFAEFD